METGSIAVATSSKRIMCANGWSSHALLESNCFSSIFQDISSVFCTVHVGEYFNFKVDQETLVKAGFGVRFTSKN